jgi:hypothetical protein
MQDRYVGDVGDFAKYGLLRRLAGAGNEQLIRLAVVWCLFPDETHNNDGRHVSYLRRRDFEGLDDTLLAALQKIIASGERCISAVSRGGLFPVGTVFCDAVVSAPAASRPSPNDRLQYRAAWLGRCVAATEKSDLVFFDPDNGLEVASVPKHHPSAGKYIYWDELARFWRRGDALLVYHHINRTMPAARQVSDLRSRFQETLEGAIALPLVFRRGSCRIFWLVYRSSVLGMEIERRARDFLSAGWSRHFRPVGWPGQDQIVMRSAL